MYEAGQMTFSSKKPSKALVGLVMAIVFSSHGCAPKPVPLGVTLDTPKHHVLSGMRFIDLGRFDEALREFDLIKERDPTFSKAYSGRGLVFACQGHYDMALRELKQGKSLARTDEEKVFASVATIRLFVMGKESAAIHWFAEAESAYHDAVTRLPDASQAHFFMGKAYEEVGDMGKARVLYEKVLYLDSTHVAEARAALDRIRR
jgi:tetratricopeptide (TPR) repeat protein